MNFSPLPGVVYPNYSPRNAGRVHANYASVRLQDAARCLDPAYREHCVVVAVKCLNVASHHLRGVR